MIPFSDISEDCPPRPGYRLTSIEVFNWGTFDQKVHRVEANGETTLLVGENGSGKSTIVDAILTLLVRPKTRNYNVAAGGGKTERDERTYIRGAHDRTVDRNGTPKIQYLRKAGTQFSYLLATFANESNGDAFTVAQVLSIHANNQIEKVYAIADEAISLADQLDGFTDSVAIKPSLQSLGFRTTTSYKQYFTLLQRKTGLRDKAMDIFNQTVAVKDVQRLDQFIRSHMLEAKPWREKTDRLVQHFGELAEAHRVLEKARQQQDLLIPIETIGKKFKASYEQLNAAQSELEVSDAFFVSEELRLLTSSRVQWSDKIESLKVRASQLDSLQEQKRSELAQVQLDLEVGSDGRAGKLQELVTHAKRLAEMKRNAREQFYTFLNDAKLAKSITSPDQFMAAQSKLAERRDLLRSERAKLRKSSSEEHFNAGQLQNEIVSLKEQIEQLANSQGNIPEPLRTIRVRLAEQIGIPTDDLPFAGELIAVGDSEVGWRASIELVLANLATSLLVPETHYREVAEFIESHRMEDQRGRGLKLVYVKAKPNVGTVRTLPNPKTKGASLVSKLVFRTEHPLAGWLAQHVQDRFDFLACDTVADFREARGKAMTQNRHIKWSTTHHQKDDRNEVHSQQHHRLGWSNQGRLDELENVVQQMEADWHSRLKTVEQIDSRLDSLSAELHSIELALGVTNYDSIDVEFHECEISSLQSELNRLENADDRVAVLSGLQQDLKAEVDGYKQDRDRVISQLAALEQDRDRATERIARAESYLEQFRARLQILDFEKHFQAIRDEIGEPLTLEALETLPAQFTLQLRKRFDQMRAQCDATARELSAAMIRYFRKFPSEQSDLDASPESLESFLALKSQIVEEDLPRHELRFKKRLNEKVLHEVGLLNGALENEREEIQNKISQLNTALETLQWKPGTYMRLEATDSQDREIREFRRELTNCLNVKLTSDEDHNENTFRRLENLLMRLQSEDHQRWCQKVIDVRNWFHFAAREYDRESGQARSYYDGGTGQSGGEKGKLAFLVLVAAIAYQYNLDPNSENEDRFHFVMVDEMFSRSDDQHAEYALELFERFGLQLLIVAPLDAKARVTEPYVGTYVHVVKDKKTNRSQLLTISAEHIANAQSEAAIS